MNHTTARLETTAGPVLFEDLRLLAAAKAPCITAVLTIPDPLQLAARIGNVIREMEKRLSAIPMKPLQVTDLVEPIRSMATALERDREWSIGLALFRSPDQFRYFFLRELPTEFVTVAERFQIRPLLAVVSRDQLFYVLALSQKHVRLFRCTYQGKQELQLRRLAPDNLHVWLNNRIPDHVLDNRAIAGPSVGSMKGVVFGTSTDRERKDEYLSHFFNQVDQGVHHFLLRETAPLILAGVETEMSIYRKVNTYSHLLDKAIPGAPEKLSPADLHDRAIEIIRESHSAPLQKVLNEFSDFRDRKRVALRMDEVLERASEGRVSDLLIREDAVYLGVCHDSDQLMPAGSFETRLEDLLNLAALQTVKHRGQAFSLKAHEMPDRLDVAAFLRF